MVVSMYKTEDCIRCAPFQQSSACTEGSRSAVGKRIVRYLKGTIDRKFESIGTMETIAHKK